MPTEIDKLQIEINAKATNANKSLDTLVVKLDALTSRLGKINGSSLVGLANGVNALGNSVKLIAGIDSRKFGSLATNISKISTLDTASINRAASAMNQLTRSLNSLGAVSQSAMQISQVASNVAKLGGVKVDKAITNMPKLTKELSKFMRAMANTPQISRNIVDMTNALANLASQSRGISTATNGLSNGLSRANNSIKLTSKSTFSLAKAFGKFYASYFLVIRGIKGLWSSIEKTADYFEAFNYFNVAFDKIAREWNHQYAEYGYENGEAYADSFKDRMEETFAKLSGIEFDMDKGILSETGLKNLGLNIQQITQYASQLASVTNSLEFTGEASVATSQALVKLAGDISSLFNVDYDQVSSNLTSGMLGMSRSLYKYGIDITQATLQTKAYELGLSKAVSEMTQGEKAQLRLLAILDQSSVAWGDQANTINSLSNQMRVMKNTWSETSMIFGQLFVPMLEDALPVINGIIIALRRLLVEVAGFMGVEIDPNKFNTGMNESEDALDGITGELEDATEAVKEYQNQLLGFDEINKLQEVDLSSKLDGDDGSLDLTDEILDATEKYEEVWNKAYANMENRAEQWADKISEYFTANNLFDIGSDVSGLVIQIYDFFTKAIDNVAWDEVGESVGEFLAGIDWSEILVSSLRLKFNIVKAILEVWANSFEEAPIETFLLTALGAIKFTRIGNEMASSLLTSFKSSIFNGFESMGGLSGILTTDLSIVMGAGSMAEIGVTIGTGIISGITTAFAGWNIGQWIYEWFTKEDIEMSFGEQMSYLGDWFWHDVLGFDREKSQEEINIISAEAQSIINSVDSIVESSKKLKQLSREKLEDTVGNVEYLTRVKDAYFELADKQSLSADEEIKLVAYARELVDLLPDLNKYINTETGEYAGQREEIEKLIKTKKKQMLQNIAMERQSEILQEIVEYEMERAEIADDVAEAVKRQQKRDEEHYKTIKKLNEEYTALSNEYDSLNNKRKDEGLTGEEYARYLDLQLAIKEYAEEIQNVVKEYENLSASDRAIIAEDERLKGVIDGLTTEYENYEYAIENATDDVHEFADAVVNSPKNHEVKFNINTMSVTSQLNTLNKTIANWEFAPIEVKIAASIDEKAFKESERKLNSLGQLASNPLFNFGSNLKLPGFATGGFPEDGLFMANHGELVGKFANGRTAVANNEQITSGIANAVGPAVYNAVLSAMSNIPSGNGDVIVTIDGKEVFRAVQKQANNYTMQTGQMAFS